MIILQEFPFADRIAPAWLHLACEGREEAAA